MQPRPVLIMAGGTGGHVYPALAVADYLRKQQVPVLWLGTMSGLEARVAPENDYPLLSINVSGLRGHGLLRWLLAPLRLSLALCQALRIMLRHKPAAVLGLGGYAGGPGGIAAWLLRIPLCLHEQNAIAGMTNRILAPFARHIMQGFPATFAKSKKISTTGNPVRDALSAIPEPEQRFSKRHKVNMRLLVLGGSQGARKLNQTLPAAIRQLPAEVMIDIRHQTGARHLRDTTDLYKELGVDGVRLDAFIEDMAAAYRWADLVLCRAGALTIAELCVVGLAAILVPFPYAVDDHQTANARYLSDSGAAVLLPEQKLDTHSLADLLQALAQDRPRLLDMASKCKARSYPDATRDVGKRCLELIHV